MSKMSGMMVFTGPVKLVFSERESKLMKVKYNEKGKIKEIVIE